MNRPSWRLGVVAAASSWSGSSTSRSCPSHLRERRGPLAATAGDLGQFRIQGGVQLGFEGFARGQAVELNYAVITSLQPTRSWAPQLGPILSSYF